MAEHEDAFDGMSDLEDLFADARQAPVQMPKALQAAILRDAAQLQQDRAADQAQSEIGGAMASENPLRRVWRQFSAAVGGWPALGGLAMASLTGLWIGLAPPSFLPDPVAEFAAFTSGSHLISEQGYDVSLLMSDEVFE